MKGIILAAGRGSRLGPLTADAPKCMVPVAGRPLIEWQHMALHAAGVDELAVVTGYCPDLIPLPEARRFHNSRWQDTNMVASLATAREWLAAEECIVSYSDIFYPPSAVRTLLDAPRPIAVTYDPDWEGLWSRRFEDPLSDAETFRLGADGCVAAIGEQPQDIRDVQGQYMGLLKFAPEGWRAAEAVREELSGSERDRLDMTSLLRRLIAADVPIHAVAVNGGWGEVDNESDLHLYSAMVAEGAFPWMQDMP